MKLREKLNTGWAIGTHVSMTDPCICELLGYVGFDYIWIDMEHTAIDYKTLLCHLNGAKAAGVDTVVRVPENDFVTLKKVMEMGPDGIVFPMVKSLEQARSLIDYTFYPPVGNRGFGPARAIRYGVDDVNDYIAGQDDKMLRFVQIEHINAVDLLPQLVTIRGIDGFIIGPCDLSGSIGELNRVFAPNTTELIRRTIREVKAAGKTIGLSYGPYDGETIAHWKNLGIEMLSVGNDAGYILDGARAALRNLRAVYEGKVDEN